NIAYNTTADQWITVFEDECARFNIQESNEKIGIFRLFMDKSSIDWYSSMLIKLSIDSEWALWKQKFCDTFANKGWSPITYALFFKYKDGSLLDFAMKKKNSYLK
ncbi:hypothetical protein PV325_009979, partial [Microctonus aethiopoides]